MAGYVTALAGAGSNLSWVSCTVRFDTETVLVGHPKAHLWVEAQDCDDMDLSCSSAGPAGRAPSDDPEFGYRFIADEPHGHRPSSMSALDFSHRQSD
jgi:hypothetical protein